MDIEKNCKRCAACRYAFQDRQDSLCDNKIYCNTSDIMSRGSLYSRTSNGNPGSACRCPRDSDHAPDCVEIIQKELVTIKSQLDILTKSKNEKCSYLVEDLQHRYDDLVNKHQDQQKLIEHLKSQNEQLLLSNERNYRDTAKSSGNRQQQPSKQITSARYNTEQILAEVQYSPTSGVKLSTIPEGLLESHISEHSNGAMPKSKSHQSHNSEAEKPSDHGRYRDNQASSQLRSKERTENRHREDENPGPSHYSPKTNEKPGQRRHSAKANENASESHHSTKEKEHHGAKADEVQGAVRHREHKEVIETVTSHRAIENHPSPRSLPKDFGGPKSLSTPNNRANREITRKYDVETTSESSFYESRDKRDENSNFEKKNTVIVMCVEPNEIKKMLYTGQTPTEKSLLKDDYATTDSDSETLESKIQKLCEENKRLKDIESKSRKENSALGQTIAKLQMQLNQTCCKNMDNNYRMETRKGRRSQLSMSSVAVECICNDEQTCGDYDVSRFPAVVTPSEESAQQGLPYRTFDREPTREYSQLSALEPGREQSEMSAREPNRETPTDSQSICRGQSQSLNGMQTRRQVCAPSDRHFSCECKSMLEEIDKLGLRDKKRVRNLQQLRARQRQMCNEIVKQKKRSFDLSKMVTEGELTIAKLNKDLTAKKNIIAKQQQHIDNLKAKLREYEEKEGNVAQSECEVTEQRTKKDRKNKARISSTEADLTAVSERKCRSSSVQSNTSEVSRKYCADKFITPVVEPYCQSESSDADIRDVEKHCTVNLSGDMQKLIEALYREVECTTSKQAEIETKNKSIRGLQKVLSAKDKELERLRIECQENQRNARRRSVDSNGKNGRKGCDRQCIPCRQ